jgi:acyl-coenzyme A thioesterase 9
VGKSSLDVLVEVHDAALYEATTNTTAGSTTALGSVKSRLLSSFFTYVARNRDTDKAAVVNPLLVTGPQEEHLQSTRNSLALQRKAQRTSSANAGHSAEHEMSLQRLIEAGSAMEDMPALAHPNAVLMKLTGLENSVVCQPQNVNTAGRVFGGFIS